MPPVGARNCPKAGNCYCNCGACKAMKVRSKIDGHCCVHDQECHVRCSSR